MIARKDCPRCNGRSFSLSYRKTWLCPYCGKDLTKLPTKGYVLQKFRGGQDKNNKKTIIQKNNDSGAFLHQNHYRL